MNNLRFSRRPPWASLSGPARVAVAFALLLALALGAGCAKQSGTAGIGGGASSTQGTGGTATTASATGTGGTATTASATGTGGHPGTTASATGTGGHPGTGGTGGTGGAGTSGAGTGGVPFTPPVGTADYPAEHEPNDLPAMANPLQAGTKGFTASIYPLGDIDVFSFVVAGVDTTVTVATSDGMGGCPAGAHTYVRIFDASGNVIAINDGATGCVLFNPSNTPGLLGLPNGTYYVHVESAVLATIPDYVLDIQVAAPSCGDGIVQVPAGEQCDHGATNGGPGDGCSATCQILSGSYLNETEPNNTLTQANSLVGFAGGVGEISPGTDADFYTVDVTVAGSSITATVGDGFGACPGFASVLNLYNASGSLLATDQGGGVIPCSAITPAKYAAAANLPVGKYALSVADLSSVAQLYYVLEVTVAPPGCGDGLIEPPEQCDPGPTPVAGCSATCTFTADYIPETEPNNTLTTANPLGTHAGFVGAIKPAGDVDYFSFTVPGPSSLVFLQTSDGLGGCPSGFDSILSLYGPSGAKIVTDDNGGVGLCSQISPVDYPALAANLPAGTYTAGVALSSSTALASQYVLTVDVRQPGCGNGVIEAGEQCDAGSANGTAGAGCSATCQSLAPWEIEPNNAGAQATPQWSGYSTWKGAINPVGDHDYYQFVLAAPGVVTLVTHDIDTPTVCTSDTYLTLLDSTGIDLAHDDDAGPGPGEPGAGKCSKITSISVPAGTYYTWVQHFGDLKPIAGYQLDLTVM